MNSRAVTESVGRLFPAYREMRYTGFGHANFVAVRDGLWFFGKCERFGYNAHPNLFWTLNRDPLAATLASIADHTFQSNVSPGFGASCSRYMEHPRSGHAVRFPDEVYGNLYFYRRSNRLSFVAATALRGAAGGGLPVNHAGVRRCR